MIDDAVATSILSERREAKAFPGPTLAVESSETMNACVKLERHMKSTLPVWEMWYAMPMGIVSALSDTAVDCER